MTKTISFVDSFRELSDELETEVNDWHLNNFYLDFEEEISEDKSVSQSQLQVAVSTTQEISDKGDGRFFHQLPDYLSVSNSSFQTRFFSELRRIYNPISFQDLQQLAYLTHQLTIIYLHQQLWHAFLQSGTSQRKQQEQLSSSSPPPPTTDNATTVWPKLMTRIMIAQGFLMHLHRYDNYINFIQRYLQQLKQKGNQCRLEFDLIKTRLPSHYTDAFNDKIDRFVQNEGLVTMRLHFEARIALINYSSKDRVYQLEYVQQKPTDLQLQIVNRLCSLTFEKEKAEQELLLFKVGMLYKKLPKSLDLLEMTPCTTITTISDPIIRARLSNEYQLIIQRAKVDLMDVLTRASVTKRNDCQQNFDREMTAIWENQRQLLIHERLTPVMLTIIEQRQRNTIECLKYIYELKGNFFLEAPSTSRTIH